jgi:AraC-like DNA-binding protein
MHVRSMGCRLERITDWPKRVAPANWCVHTLAAQCRVSVSTLERFIRREFGICPHRWLMELRLQHAGNRLVQGFTVKETAFEAGFKDPHHFSRDFKKHYGYPPSQHAATRVQT